MEVEVVLANEENANIIKNIYPLYLHDLSEVYEFFLLRPYREKNIAPVAAKQVFDKFKGKWGLFVAAKEAGSNPRAEKFWRKTISDYTYSNFEENLGPTFDGAKLIFTFDNKELYNLQDKK